MLASLAEALPSVAIRGTAVIVRAYFARESGPIVQGGALHRRPPWRNNVHHARIRAKQSIRRPIGRRLGRHDHVVHAADPDYRDYVLPGAPAAAAKGQATPSDDQGAAAG